MLAAILMIGTMGPENSASPRGPIVRWSCRRIAKSVVSNLTLFAVSGMALNWELLKVLFLSRQGLQERQEESRYSLALLAV